ncbi:MAG: helix-turn-helix transcriptional regulator [Bacteroidota bacterium]
MKNIGQKVRRIREEKQWTQEFIANKLEISQNTYSKIESGSIKLTIDRISELSKILEVPIEDMLSDDTKTFHLNNNHIEKFYIENLQEENKGLVQSLKDQVKYLQDENQRLLKLIEISVNEKITKQKR